MVDLHLWRIWVRQLGWWNSQGMEKMKCSKPPTRWELHRMIPVWSILMCTIGEFLWTSLNLGPTIFETTHPKLPVLAMAPSQVPWATPRLWQRRFPAQFCPQDLQPAGRQSWSKQYHVISQTLHGNLIMICRDSWWFLRIAIWSIKMNSENGHDSSGN